jgi:hypothetical protein
MQRLADMNGLQMGSNIVGFSTLDDASQKVLTNIITLRSTSVWGFITFPNLDSQPQGTNSTFSYNLYADFPQKSIPSPGFSSPPLDADLLTNPSNPVFNFNSLKVQSALEAAILSFTRSPNTYTPSADTYAVNLDFFEP